MEQNQEQKQSKLAKLAFIAGIAAVAFEILGFLGGELFWILSDLICLAGVVLAIIVIVKKLEPKKKAIIGGGLSILIFIFAYAIGWRNIEEEAIEEDDYSEYGYYDYTPSSSTTDNKLKKKAIDFTTRAYEADKKGDKDTMAKLEKEVAAFLKDLSKSDQELFQTYVIEHMEFLEKGATTTSSKSYEEPSSVEIDSSKSYEESSSVETEEEPKEVVRTTTKHKSSDDDDNDNDNDGEYASGEYEAGYKPSKSEIEALANKYAKKELAVYNHDDYEDRAAKLDEELASEVSHWTKSAKERVFDLQEKKFDALVDKRDKKEAASDDDE